jgi:hypothetical protein
MSATAPLVCPGCRAEQVASERFCRACGMPLVHGEAAVRAAPALSERQERARKVKAQYSDGPLVRVARARHQAEAELIAGLLLEEGVASVVRRSGGFDVPDFLAAGPRDVLVAESGLDVARDVLRIVAPDGPPARPREGTPAWVQAMAVTLIVVVLVATAAGVGLALLG